MVYRMDCDEMSNRGGSPETQSRLVVARAGSGAHGELTDNRHGVSSEDNENVLEGGISLW